MDVRKELPDTGQRTATPQNMFDGEQSCCAAVIDTLEVANSRRQPWLGALASPTDFCPREFVLGKKACGFSLMNGSLDSLKLSVR